MRSSLKTAVSRNLTNARGWKTSRKIVVIESDDWGSVRIKDKATFQSLLDAGIRVDQSKYDSLDCLESKTDLQILFNLLSSHVNSNKQHPVFTFNAVMQNPDFDKIKEANFETFIGENFTETYKRYYNEDNFYMWESAIKENLIHPQFHAKEHLNAYLWLNDLRLKNRETVVAFNHDFFGLKTKTSSDARNHYLATYYAENEQEFDYVKKGLIEGLQLFENKFGFKSETFIACNYFWPQALEKILFENNVLTLQGQNVQLAPVQNGGKLNKIRHYTGQKNKYNQNYTVRNVIFEPYLDPNLDWATKAFIEIEHAFKWKTPAIISSHRINYVGGISETNRTNSIKQLKCLLEMTLKAYPDVEFLSSSELGTLLHQ